jgi:hypothetical protein
VTSLFKRLRKSCPWSILLVIAGVDAWLKNSAKGDWSTVTVEMRHSALQAGLSEMNHFSYWYSELANYDKEYTRELFINVLLFEDTSQSFYPRLANRLIEHEEDSFFHQIAFTYLSEHYEVSREVAVALMKTLLTDKIEDDKLYKLIDIGMNRLHRGDILEGMIFLAGAWRYCPHQVWTILQKLHIWQGKERTHDFECWLTAIEKIHIHTPKYTWPDWVHEDALIEMLPDLFNTYPPATDPSIDDYNYGGSDVKKRRNSGFLRGDTLKKIAESGSEKAREALYALLEKEENRANRNYILDALDQWKEAHSQKAWTPLSPHELWEVIEKDRRPVRDHEELFELTVEVIEDIREQIQGGDTNLKHVFWDENLKDKPRKEETFQIIIFDKIKTHSLWKKIIAGRELEVKDRNRPDIFVACKLPNGNTAKVYIEMKRQNHDNLITAILNQLADKYLTDHESHYGIYLVSWYGTNHYKTKKAIKNELGDIPQTPQALEESLQTICDQVVREYINVNGMRAIVIDLS